MRGFSGKGFLQRDLHIVTQVRPALTAVCIAGTAAAAHHLAKNVFKNVGKPAASGKASAATAALLEGGVAKTVISGAFLRVFQRLIGLAQFLELAFGARIALVAVGMVFHGKLAISRFQRRIVGAFGNAERFIKVSFGHIVFQHQSVSL